MFFQDAHMRLEDAPVNKARRLNTWGPCACPPLPRPPQGLRLVCWWWVARVCPGLPDSGEGVRARDRGRDRRESGEILCGA